MNEQLLVWSLVGAGALWCLWACWRVGQWRKPWVWRGGLAACAAVLVIPVLMGADEGSLARTPSGLAFAGAVWLVVVVPLALLGAVLVESLRLAGWAAGSITSGRRRAETREPDGSPRN